MWLAILLAAQTLELLGRIQPAPERSFVTLTAATTPFAVSTVAGPDGRFRFRGLEPGAYTLSVLAPGRGEVRRTVQLSAGSADRQGRLEILVPFDPPPQTLAEGHTVSLASLRIPEAAVREYQRAQERLAERDVEGAEQCLRRAVRLAPQFAAAWNQLGTIAYQSGRREQAAEFFREALRQEPAAYSPLVNLGGVLINLGRYQEALELNLRAVREQPQDALAQVQLGVSYWALGDAARAIEHLREAKRLDPEHFSQPELVLAQIYLDRGEREAAARELEEFLARRPDSPEAPRIRRQLEQLKKTKP